MSSSEITKALAAKKTAAAAALEHIESGADLIVGLGNGEPVSVIDAIEDGFAARGLEDVRIHQMLPLYPRRYMRGEIAGLRHVSYFLSGHNRQAYHDGHCDLVPNNFSEVPHLMRAATKCSLLLASASPPDAHGFFSMGPDAEYIAALSGEYPVFIEANARMPRTYGENQVHIRDVVGWCDHDHPLIEVPPAPAGEIDIRIAELVAERIPNGATLQVGVGSVPDQVLAKLSGHEDLGVHTELFGEGFIDLIDAGVITGSRKKTHRYKALTTTALGSQRMYDWVADNAGIEFWPVDYTNDPAQHRPRAAHEHRERDTRGRLPGPVRIGVARQRLLVVIGRAGRLRPRRAVRGGRPVVHRASLLDA